MKAACDVVAKNATYLGSICPMIEPILRAALASRGEAGDLVNDAAKGERAANSNATNNSERAHPRPRQSA